MVNREKKLTVDDLIIEYMMYKVDNCFETSFSTSEFIEFLHFFETKMEVYDVLYDGEVLFKRFFNRKAESDWTLVEDITRKKHFVPHMDMKYNDKLKDYVISANYKLNQGDKSIINTFFMDNGMSMYNDYKGSAWKVRNIIKEYLSNQPKRTIDETIKVNENELLIGKYLSIEIITQIWYSYIEELIKNNRWPKQCTDINKYLFEIDLAELIELKSIKKELLELYNVFSKRIAILYHMDNNLKISSYSNTNLAKANYDLLISGYEKIVDIAFKDYKKTIEFDLSSFTIKEKNEVNDICFWDDGTIMKTTSTYIPSNNSENIAKLLESFEYNPSKTDEILNKYKNNELIKSLKPNK